MRARWVAVLAASGLAVAAAGAVALFGGRWSDWTHADLITRLESKGIPVAAVRSDRGPGLSMYFFTGGVEYEYRQLAVKCVWALAAIGTSDAVRVLREAANSEDAPIREAAERKLGITSA